jgi:hypothetical protein
VASFIVFVVVLATLLGAAGGVVTSPVPLNVASSAPSSS